MTDIEGRLATLEAEVTELRDRESIRDVLYRYCRAVDRLDTEIMKSCYHEDAYDTHWFANGPAHPFSDWVIAEVLPHARTTVHSVANPIIELKGSRAFVESHVHVLHEVVEPGVEPEMEVIHQLTECRYLDLFEKRDGEWKIFYRHVVRDNLQNFRVPADDPVRVPEALGRRDKSDPVYAGFDLLSLRPDDMRVNFFEPWLAGSSD